MRWIIGSLLLALLVLPQVGRAEPPDEHLTIHDLQAPGQAKKATHTPRPTATTALTGTPPPSVATATPTQTALPVTTPVAGQPCPLAVHDSSTTTGPDGKLYPTWHPPVDPTTGCFFGHEHGDDPRTSLASNTMPAFGYIGGLVGDNEPHVGFKVHLLKAGTLDTDGGIIPADIRLVFHQGTSGLGRYTTQFHSMQYDAIWRDGSGREMHLMGMADTGGYAGSVCSRQGNGKTIPEVPCQDPYEIWNLSFDVKVPGEFVGPMQSRISASAAFAAFDPIVLRHPQSPNTPVYSQDYFTNVAGWQPGVDPFSDRAIFRGCQREVYGGPSFWHNAGRPTTYYTDAYGNVVAGPGPGVIEQRVSAVDWDWRTDRIPKVRTAFCDASVRAPN